jgi:hypothetical protein
MFADVLALCGPASPATLPCVPRWASPARPPGALWWRSGRFPNAKCGSSCSPRYDVLDLIALNALAFLRWMGQDCSLPSGRERINRSIVSRVDGLAASIAPSPPSRIRRRIFSWCCGGAGRGGDRVSHLLGTHGLYDLLRFIGSLHSFNVSTAK